MSQLTVFASAFSRLHADLIIVRLKRAGIVPALLSVIHPLASRPNSALCWLGGSKKLRLASGEKIATSGFLGESLQTPDDQAGSTTFVSKLAQLGLTHEQCVSLEETMLETRVVVAIKMKEKSELRTILQVLQQAGAEKVFTAHLDLLKPSDAARAVRASRHGMPAAA